MIFAWLVFFALCVLLGERLGLPSRLALVLFGVVLLLMLLALLGVFGGARFG
jgi:hypothetical protein